MCLEKNNQEKEDEAVRYSLSFHVSISFEVHTGRGVPHVAYKMCVYKRIANRLLIQFLLLLRPTSFFF